MANANLDSLDAVDKQMGLEQAKNSNNDGSKKEEERDLIKNGIGELEIIPHRKMLAASNIMKRPEQLLGFVPAMGGVYISSNSTYGSGRLAHF